MLSIKAKFALLLVLGTAASTGDAKVVDLSLACKHSHESCELSNLTSTFDDPLIVQDSRNIASGLKHLVLKSCKLATVPKSVFQFVPKLEHFEMSRGLMNSLRPDDFAGVKGTLRSVNLKHNRLSELPENVFANLPEVEEIRLGHNQILHVHGRAFNASKLKFLELNSNNIRELFPGVFETLLLLEHIDLSYNHIEKISSDTFRNNVNLKTILLNDNNIAVFQSNSFERFPQIKLLDLSRNVIEDVRLQSVTTLHINNARLRNCFVNGSVWHLHANHNQLETLWVEYPRYVMDVEMRNNSLASLDMFSDMSLLGSLDVSANHLNDSSLATLKKFNFIRHLNLSSNHIEHVKKNTFHRPSELFSLDLSHNNIAELDITVLDDLKYLENLYLHGNKLKSLDYEATVKTHKKLAKISFFDNDLEPHYLKSMEHFFRKRKIKVITQESAITDENDSQSASRDDNSNASSWITLIVSAVVIVCCGFLVFLLIRYMRSGNRSYEVLSKLSWKRPETRIVDDAEEAL